MNQQSGGVVSNATLTPGKNAPAYPHLTVDLKRLEELPTLPAVAMQVLQVVRNPRSSAKDVEAVVMRDPVLSAKILRVANSSFYSFASKIATVGHAISVLGFNQVQSLLLGISVFDKFRTRRLDLHGFWQHAIATAIGAKFLARKVNLNPDQVFTAGLLHDIGKLAFSFLWEGIYLDVLRLQHRETVSSYEAEMQLLGNPHTTIGGMMAANWSLPEEYIQAIRYHHEPLHAGDPYRSLCCVICAANIAAHEAFPTLFAHTWDMSELEGVKSLVNLTNQVEDECISHIQDSEESINAFLSSIQ